MSPRLAAALLALLAAACSPARRGEPLAGPLPLADARLAKGRQLFDTHCYKCHGEGDGGLGPVINDKPLPRFLMHFQVRHGLGAMPAFSPEQISEADVDTLLDYVVALRRHGK